MKAVRDVQPLEVNDIGSEASHSFDSKSNASSVISKSHSLNSDLKAKDFVKQKKSTASRKGEEEVYELNYEKRDVPF